MFVIFVNFDNLDIFSCGMEPTLLSLGEKQRKLVLYLETAKDEACSSDFWKQPN